ncbi:MAG TPA: hypothetical protein VMH32_09370 [Burkholderiales bacterium]|nr:hypothetical protein [Burkholderiales bacterium]
MSEALADQAAGLRRLLRGGALRSITLVGAGADGDPSLATADLAAALARHGRAVLLLECTDKATDALDIGHQAEHRPPGEAGTSSLQVLRASFAGRQDALRLVRALDPAAKSADILLIEASPPADLACAAAARELILAVSPSAVGITGAYRFLKRLHHPSDRRRIFVLVHRGRSETHAGRIFGNLSATCRRFLNLSVEYMGCIPDDERIERGARLSRPVAEPFPRSGPALAWDACAERLLRWPGLGDDDMADFARRLIAAAPNTLSQS